MVRRDQFQDEVSDAVHFFWGVDQTPRPPASSHKARDLARSSAASPQPPTDSDSFNGSASFLASEFIPGDTRYEYVRSPGASTTECRANGLPQE